MSSFNSNMSKLRIPKYLQNFEDAMDRRSRRNSARVIPRLAEIRKNATQK